MKRIIPAALLVVMALLLCGCSIFYTAYDNALPDTLARGVIAQGVYTSDYAGLSFTAPEGWTFTTDEELADLMDMSADAMSDAGMEFSEDALKKQVLYDMQAKDPYTGANVLLLYENLALTGNTGISETKYLETTIKQLKDADVYAYAFGEITETQLCGQTYQMVQADMTDYGMTQYYYARKVGKYMLCTIISLPSAGDVSDITGCFAAYAPDTSDTAQSS
ncbi:MAG: hypothetical protein AAGU77_13880 [Bacillota bacterium]